MGKFKKYGGVSEWDAVMSEYPQHTFTIYALTEVRTKNGPAFVANCDVLKDGKPILEKTDMLMGGSVPYDQLTEYLRNSADQPDQFPVDVLLDQVERAGGRDYWILRDPHTDDDK